jgi:hypothetical protein
METTSHTPRTDTFIGDQDGTYMTEGEIAMREFARQLETELAEANERASSAEFRLNQEKHRNDDHEQDYLAVWKLIKRPDETVVQAAQRVSGELAEAVKRMEAVDSSPSIRRFTTCGETIGAMTEDFRARLISAAKGEQQ